MLDDSRLKIREIIPQNRELVQSRVDFWGAVVLYEKLKNVKTALKV
jgi:hypothetical protein